MDLKIGITLHYVQAIGTSDESKRIRHEEKSSVRGRMSVKTANNGPPQSRCRPAVSSLAGHGGLRGLFLYVFERGFTIGVCPGSAHELRGDTL